MRVSRGRVIARGAMFEVLLVCALTSSAPAARAASSGADSCRSLSSFTWPGLVVREARFVAAGPPDPPGGVPPETVFPEHCLLHGVLGPRTGAGGLSMGLGFEMRLPLTWNGRFAFEGGGGLDGVQRPAYGSILGSLLPPALARGFVVVSGDGGHQSATANDARFGLDQQARIDFAYNAIDKVTLVAKAVVRAFYGRDPEHSYFVGCSNGGREALIAAQRLPLAFDGIVAGAPAFRLTWTAVDQVWNERVLASAAPRSPHGHPILSRAFSDSDLKLVADTVLRQCDALDGLADGMINDYRACKFDPKVLRCPGAKHDTCLSSTQVEALRALMGGPHDPRGRSLYTAFPYDTAIANPSFRQAHLGDSSTATPNSLDATLGFDALRYLHLTPPDPGFDPLRFDFDRDLERVEETARLVDADATFLQTFAGHGKLILYHGLGDPGLSALDTAAWYERLHEGTGGITQNWARLFLVPGMTHCRGGQATDRFDMLTAIQQWVENGEAPQRIEATSRALPGISRPLCPYPGIARYVGGDPRAAASFECRN